MAVHEEVSKCREAAKLLEQQRRDGKLPGCISVSIGYKYKDGVRTDQIVVILGVQKKLSAADLASQGIQPFPAEVAGAPTDVIEDTEYKALVASDPLENSDIDAQQLTQRRRPTPGGFSCGHGDITAGTLGAWLSRGAEASKVILSNNHVLANSNGATIGDFIRQPGRADGGGQDDRIARLEEFVRINFGDPGDGDDGKKNTAIARLWWGAMTAVANLPARLTGCPYRAVVVDERRRLKGAPDSGDVVTPLALDQPFPNLVDAAVARQFGGNVVDEEIWNIGKPAGFRDLQLGDRVEKTGRTTEHTVGLVERVEATSSVNFGTDGTAEFEDQFIIREIDGGDFSAGGDSGSVILVDGMIGGLLFAGGGGVTIANRISHVVSFLGIRL